MRTQDANAAISALRDRIPAEARIYAPGCAGESPAVISAFADAPHLAAGATFLGVWIPGVNGVDYAGLHSSARAETIFMAPPHRAGFESGAVAMRPLSYTQAYAWLETTPLDAALIHTSPPDADNMVSLGVSADFATAVWARPDIVKLAHVNARMPAPPGSPRINLDAFDIILERDAPLLAYEPPSPPPVFNAVAENVARLIRDGDTLQFGLGNVQLAMLRALAAKKHLRIHSGMISDPVLAAVAAGAIDDAPGAVTTGVALGSRALYEFCAADQRLRFAPVNHTHAVATLGAIDNFVAVNSVIEVDLYGQANAEYIGDRLASGSGGLVDFLRGAAASPGGRPIAALASTAKNGSVSRIVPNLRAPSISVSRADMGFVVTEHGVADLRGRSVDERAAALIAVADPAHRAGLAAAWRAMKEDA